jgi:ribosomal protein S14
MTNIIEKIRMYFQSSTCDYCGNRFHKRDLLQAIIGCICRNCMREFVSKEAKPLNEKVKK